MKTCILFAFLVGAVAAQSASSGPGQMGSINSISSAMSFLQNNGINPGTLIYTNCINNGNQCSPGALPCCFSPIYTCQSSPSSGQNKCLLSPGLRNQVPSIKQIDQMFGVVTQNPIQ